VDYAAAERGTLPRWLHRVIARYVPPGGRVLEAGCGLAEFTVAARALGYRATGLDWAPDTVAIVRARFPDLGIQRGDVRHLPFADGSFDAVYSPGVCEHFVEGPEAVLAETRRVLGPGGVALITTPCFNSLRRRLARRDRFHGPPGEAFYQYAFSLEDMSDRLRRLGFEVVHTSTWNTMLAVSGHFPWLERLPRPALAALYRSVDHLPVTRGWGHMGLWVARRRKPSASGRCQ
jgi:SAM-dependent methyltransferase